MKKCKACKTDIDAKASKCPHCQTDQRNWFLKHPILTGILILIIIGVVGSANSGSTKKSESAEPAKTTTTTEEKPTEKPVEKFTKMNEPAQDGDLVFTVLSLQTAKTLGNSFTNKNAQGLFHVVKVKIENKGKKTATFDSSMAKVKDSQDREFERSVEGQTAKGLSEGNIDLFLQQIQPGLSVTGELVFDLPADVKDPVIELKGSLFGSGVRVKLEK